MGTRATTTFIDNYFSEEGVALVTLYRQSDGYPEGHGNDLRDAIGHLQIVNGIRADSANQANGVGCLAAQAIAKLKTDIGLHYIAPPDAENEFHHYEIKAAGSADERRAGESYPVWMTAKYRGEVYYDGLLSEFDAALANETIAASLED